MLYQYQVCRALYEPSYTLLLTESAPAPRQIRLEIIEDLFRGETIGHFGLYQGTVYAQKYA